jgi:hypothetical protein
MGMFFLARRLTGSPGAAMVAAALFAYTPHVFSKLPHIQLLMTGGMPFCLLAFHRLIERPDAGRSVVLALVLVTQGLACAYYGIFCALMTGLATVFYAVSRGLWRNRRFLFALAGAGVLSVGLIVPFFLPYVDVQAGGAFSRSLKDASMYSADWQAYFASAAILHRWMLPLLKDWNEVLFPGFLAIGLAAGGLWTGFSRRDATLRVRETTVFYALLGALALWASFGPRAGLYTILFHTIPIFSLLRAPARFGILVELSLAVLAAILVARLSATRRWVAPVIALAAVVELLQVPLPLPEVQPFSPTFQMLAQMPRGAVAAFPFYSNRGDYPRHAQYMLFSTAHWQPLINGYSDYIPDDFRDAAIVLDTFPSREAFRTLERFRARYIVLHFNLYDHRTVPRIQTSLQRDYAPYLRLLVRDQDVWIYQIVAYPPPP